MAIVLKDRVKETASAPGTGTITLAGAAPGFQAFSAIGNGNVTYFAIVDAVSGAWEVNYGTYSSGTLTRNATPLSSSAAGALVNFTSAVDVFCTYPSEKAIYEEVSGNVLIDGGPITVVGTGVTSYTTFDAALGEFYANVAGFAQLYAQNLNDDATASTDIVAYNDLGDGTNNFIDMGISSSNYSDITYPIFTAGSGYVYNDGGELIIGSATDDLLLFAGGIATTNWALRVDKTTQAITTKAGLTIGAALTGVGGSFTAAVTSTSTSTSSPANNEFVTKAYVDNATSTGIHIHAPVYAESAANLSANYTGGGTNANIIQIANGTDITFFSVTPSVNDQFYTGSASNGLLANTPYYVVNIVSGSTVQVSLTYGGVVVTGLTNGSPTIPTVINSGVGAYLESTVNATFAISGVTGLTAGQRILVRGQTTAAYNGVYDITSMGSGGSKWKLTRSSDADTVSPQDPNGLGEGDYFFVTFNSEAFVLTTPEPIIIGYTALTYTLFSSVPVYTGTSPIDVTGTVISLTTVPATLGGTGTGTVATGDLLYGSAANTWSKLTVGSAYKSLVVNGAGTLPEWNAVALNQSGAVSGTLPEVNGGTNQSSYATGDTLYASAANTLSKLTGNTTVTKKFLTQTGTGSASQAPAWGTVDGADVSGNISGQAGSVANALTAGTYLTSGGTFDGSVARTFAVDATSANTVSKVVARDSSGNFSAGTITATLTGSATSAGAATNLAGGTANQIPYQTAAGTTSFITAASGTNYVLNYTGTAFSWVAGTISGVPLGSNLSGLSAGTYMTYSVGTTYNGSAAATLAVDATSANTASKVVARDASGNFAAGTITAALTGNASTATTATNVTGGAAGSLVYQTGSAATTTLALGTSNYVLTAGATAPQYVAQSTLSVGSATTATTATNVGGGSANQIVYQTGSGATSFISNGTTGQVLTATTSGAPTFQTSTAASKAFTYAMGLITGI